RNVQRGDEGGLAARNRLQSIGLECVDEENGDADGRAGPQLAAGQSPHDLAGKNRRQQRRRGESQSHKKQGAADGERLLDRQEGAAPDHGDGNQGQLLAADGRLVWGWLGDRFHEGRRKYKKPRNPADYEVSRGLSVKAYGAQERTRTSTPCGTWT